MVPDMAGTILIGFDETDGAGRALDRAIEEAKASGDRLVVLAVFELPFDPEGPQSFGSLTNEAQMMPLVQPPELEPILADARARVEAAGLDADYVWAAGNVSEKITSAARDRGARLVVLAAHHHGFFGKLFGGDVAAEVEHELGELGELEVVVVD
jgi:nucleotide-binding universal stress UspA family protein